MVRVLTFLIVVILTRFSEPGVFAAEGVTHVRNSHLFFNFPGPPNFLLSKQNLQTPQSFIIHAEQLLHGILWVYFGIYKVFNSDCLFVIQYCVVIFCLKKRILLWADVFVLKSGNFSVTTGKILLLIGKIGRIKCRCHFSQGVVNNSSPINSKLANSVLIPQAGKMRKSAAHVRCSQKLNTFCC